MKSIRFDQFKDFAIAKGTASTDMNEKITNDSKETSNLRPGLFRF